MSRKLSVSLRFVVNSVFSNLVTSWDVSSVAGENITIGRRNAEGQSKEP